MKKIISLIIACVLSLTALLAVGCGGEKFDPKTTLIIGVSQDGVGRAWLDAVVTEFKKANPEINVHVDDKESEYDRTNLIVNIKKNREDLYFINDYIAQNFIRNDGTSEYLVDITELVTDGGNNSIHSKMYDDVKSYHNYGTENNPKYYSLPYFMTFAGLVYNKDVFDAHNLYNLPLYKGFDGVKGTGDENFGPDGIEETFDDGLPSTWEDMKILIMYMAGQGITPFTWSKADYRNLLMYNIWASYEGANNYKTLVNLNGTDSNLGAITKENAYKLTGQQGRKAAIMVADFLTSNAEYYSTDAFASTQDNKKALLEYVSSNPRYIKKSSGEPIAFLIEGTWWENEANQEYFGLVEESYGSQYGYGKQRFGFLPFPRFVGTDGIDNQTNEKLMLLGGDTSIATTGCFINKASTKIDMAKKFIKFMYTDEMLNLFTKVSNVFMPLDYRIENDVYNSFTDFNKSVYDFISSENSEIVIPKVRNQVLSAIGSKYDAPVSLRTLVPNDRGVDTKLNDPIGDFYAYRTLYGLTAESYFNSKTKICNEETWTTMLNELHLV